MFIVINTRDWRRAAAVLSEPEGVLWGDSPCRPPRQVSAATVEGGVGEAVGDGHTGDTPSDVIGFKWFAEAGARTAAVNDDGTVCTPTNSDSHQPAVAYAVRTANTGANGWGVAEDVAHTVDAAGPEAVAFAQNQRDEVRLIGGDGRISACINAERWGNHKGETLIAEPVCMASGQANAEVLGGVSPTLTLLHEAPIVALSQATCVTPSRLCAPQTEGTSSATTSQSTAEGSS